ncbi:MULTISPECIES: OB-fold domain-containing protein [unclassified Pseudonocardia]|uniref:Zn-ribbon domain-containing OB-fold protein n=1 Tax=unclassified Pseudonocardia TaxID=2619320 RepID=UPI0001FFE9D2|nr:OB-fold domain-containing protein [Pseudonocardia sp. Ae707_Ps1]OLM09022.1 hypothetical protein Ae707Ps1_5969c [Pseudonocardia sp. Ae707_Ps1]
MNAPSVPTADLRGTARRDDRTAPWFDALAGGVLVLRRCAANGHWARPDAAACSRCHDASLEWAPARGGGTVVAVITDHTPVRDGGEPLTLGLVELDEGPWLHARLLGEPEIGDVVSLVVLTPEPGGEGEPAPAFRRA